MHAIVQFTEGIPRTINNFCLVPFSLGCALRKRTIDLRVVDEVISDLDITKHITEACAIPALDQELLAAANSNLHVRTPYCMPSEKMLAPRSHQPRQELTCRNWHCK